MFEKEAEEHCNKQCSMCGYNDGIPCLEKCHDWQDEYYNWKDGAEFGYNKAEELRAVADFQQSSNMATHLKLERSKRIIYDLLYVYQLGKNELAIARIREEAEQFLKEVEE